MTTISIFDADFNTSNMTWSSHNLWNCKFVKSLICEHNIWYLNVEKAPEPSSADTILTLVAVFGTIFAEPDEKSRTKLSIFWKVDSLSDLTLWLLSMTKTNKKMPNFWPEMGQNKILKRP